MDKFRLLVRHSPSEDSTVSVLMKKDHHGEPLPHPTTQDGESNFPFPWKRPRLAVWQQSGHEEIENIRCIFVSSSLLLTWKTDEDLVTDFRVTICQFWQHEMVDDRMGIYWGLNRADRRDQFIDRDKINGWGGGAAAEAYSLSGLSFVGGWSRR